MPLSAYVSSGLAFARRNAGKVALVAMAVGATVAVGVRLRREARALDAEVERERKAGANRLLGVYLANSRSICAAFRNLLPKLRDLLSADALVDTAPMLARLRARPADIAEKQKLWQQLMVRSITHLVSSIYLCALLFSFLSLQMNVLARYNIPIDPMQPQPPLQLPAGPLAARSSKAFLDLVLASVLNDRRVSAAVRRIHRTVAAFARAGAVDLAHTPSLQDVNVLLGDIFEQSWNETEGRDARATPPAAADDIQRDERDDDEHEKDDGGDGGDPPSESNGDYSLSALLHSWLFDDVGALRDPQRSQPGSGPGAGDINFTWLIGELLDVCEVLDFNQYVYHNSVIVRNFVMRQLYQDIDSEAVTKRPTFARLLARFSSLASTVLSGRDHHTPGPSGAEPSSPEQQSVDITATPTAPPHPAQASSESLDRCMAENDISTYFAASVFLSGEKDVNSASNPMRRF